MGCQQLSSLPMRLLQCVLLEGMIGEGIGVGSLPVELLLRH